MREEEEKDGYEKQSRQQKGEQSRAEDGYEKQSETLGFLDIRCMNGRSSWSYLKGQYILDVFSYAMFT